MRISGCIIKDYNLKNWFGRLHWQLAYVILSWQWKSQKQLMRKIVIGLTQWSNACFRNSSKCDIFLNNMSESFNKSNIDAMDKPIITMVEAIKV